MNKNQKIRTGLYTLGSLVLLGGFFALGVYMGYSHRPWAERVANIENKNNTQASSADLEPFWKVWALINEKYPGDSPSGEARVWGATKGLVGSINDPYSVFFDPKETSSFEDSIEGEFSGVGMEVGIKDNVITVIAPLKNTPAYKAGIKPGDKILKINETITTDLTTDKAVELIKGERGTEVKLTIFRDGEKTPREIIIVRDIISIPTLETKLRDDGVFVISLFNFSAQSPYLFREALREFITSGSNKLVLDLRGNPGGYLEAAVDMASWFLPTGKTVVVEKIGKNQTEHSYKSRGYDVFTKNLKMVILVDGGSASASEILAGALSEHGVAKLIGEKTYGKGSVQELIQITKETSLKITVAKWLTPNGVSISAKGLEPDEKVTLTKEDLEASRDTQMNAAVKYLLGN